MKHWYLLLLAAFFCCVQQGFCQSKQKHFGTLVALNGTYQGAITLNLYGANEEHIMVEWEKMAPDSSKKSKYTAEFDIRAVEKIIIGLDTFYVRSLTEDNDHLMKGCLVRRIHGTEHIGLYSFATKAGLKYYVCLPGRDLYSVTHRFFTDEGSKYITLNYFKDCVTLYDKMKTAQMGYWFPPNIPVSEYMYVWKNIINDYQACKKYE